jgi:hypothetical protein
MPDRRPNYANDGFSGWFIARALFATLYSEISAKLPMTLRPG